MRALYVLLCIFVALFVASMIGVAKVGHEAGMLWLGVGSWAAAFSLATGIAIYKNCIEEDEMESVHALLRSRGRLAEAGVKVDQALPRVEEIAKKYSSVAVMVMRFAEDQNDSLDDYDDRRQSNGDQLWAICREGRVATWMFRRSNQPATTQALRVEKVVRALW